ncbi:MAG: hypothetical protein JXR95_04555 [Deltaproteobacteria bacterium]|nr:hypothetical protein [Deltaproteobacteria bacterium]
MIISQLALIIDNDERYADDFSGILGSWVRYLEKNSINYVVAYPDSELIPALLDIRVDAVLLLMNETSMASGKIQGLLEIMDIPCLTPVTGASNWLSSRVNLKDFLGVNNLSHLPSVTVSHGDSLPENMIPCIVKPEYGSLEKGVTRVEKSSELSMAVEEALKWSSRAVIERFEAGTTVTCGIYNGEVLGIAEITPTDEGTRLTIPPEMNLSRISSLKATAAGLVNRAQVKGMVTVDFICTPDGRDFVIDLNSFPILDASGVFSRIALSAGIRHEDLLATVLSSGQSTARRSSVQSLPDITF